MVKKLPQKDTQISVLVIVKYDSQITREKGEHSH